MRAEALIDLKDIAKRDNSRKQQRLQAVSGSKSDFKVDHSELKSRRAKFITFVFIVAVLVVGVLFSFNALTKLFAIEQVKIKGAFHNEQAHQIRTALLPYLQGDLLTVNLDAAYSALLELAWLEQATLRREWPNQILVQVTEYVPVAYWNDRYLLSSDSQIFEQAYAAELDDLPNLHGPIGRERDVLNQYEKIQHLLSANGMSIKSLKLDKRNTWILKTNDDTLFRLGSKDIEKRLHRFLVVLMNGTGLDLNSMQSIDLRHSNGFAVSWKIPQPTQQGKRST